MIGPRNFLFDELDVWVCENGESGPENMAMDEAMLRHATRPALRTYRWPGPEITFGYPQKIEDVSPLAAGRKMTRRCTGGGVVEHGSDLTIALAIPTSHPVSRLAPAETYRRIHRCILATLNRPTARLATAEDASAGAACFAHPACFDVMDGSRKICGGAQRRSRDGLLYQGSLHAAGLGFPSRLATALARSITSRSPTDAWSTLREELVRTRYGNPAWNRRR